MKSEKQRLVFIDSLRGVAALSVVIYHIALMPVPSLEVPSFFSLYILSGGTGVTLFFVISAFTMCLTMDKRIWNKESIYDFYARRFFRIAPLFYLILAISISRDWFVYGTWHDVKTLGLNTLFLFNFFPGSSGSIVWAGWTIGVEMVFYLVFPFMFRYVTNGIKAVVFFFLTLSISQLFHSLMEMAPLSDAVSSTFITMSIFNQLPNFSMGMITYFVFKWMGEKELNPCFYLAAFFTGLYLYHGLLIGRLNFLFDSLYWQAIIFSLVFIGTSAIHPEVLKRSGLAFLGKISFSFYLIHPLLIAGLTPAYRLVYQLNTSIYLQFSLAVLITVFPLTLLSWISYRYVEKTFIRYIAIKQSSKRISMPKSPISVNT